MNIISSASKIVFILMALGVNAALFFDKITGEQFLMLAGMAFTFYFSAKGETAPTNSTTITKNDGSSVKTTESSTLPFAGK